MAMYKLKVNGKKYEVDVPSSTPVLWVIRDTLKLTGTKFGCGKAHCGACTVNMNGNAIRSCVTPISQAIEAEIITIEGLSEDGTHPVQLAWVKEQVPQCGYCQSGQIMQTAALLDKNKDPSDKEIEDTMNTMICRCMTYPRIKKAVKTASNIMKEGGKS